MRLLQKLILRRFSLRTLTTLIVLVACFFGLIGGALQQAREQRAAVHELGEAGYRLLYDHQADHLLSPSVAVYATDEVRAEQLARYLELPSITPPLVSWPWSLLPLDARHSIVSAQPGKKSELRTDLLARLDGLKHLYLHDLPISCDDWRAISQLDGLEVLFVRSIPVDEHALLCLARLTKLKYLALQDCQLDADALSSAISNHRQLESLDLKLCTISEEAFGKFDRLPQLVALSLESTNLTDAGLARLVARLPHLERLDLSRTSISDHGLVCLRGLAKLQTLIMQDVAVDSGLEHIAHLRNLAHLDLTFSDASDSGVSHLLGSESLRSLNVKGPHVTESMASKLRQSLPTCQVTY